MDVTNTAVVGVDPMPHKVAGQLAPGDQQAVFGRVSLNTAALVAYGEADVDTIQPGQVLRPV